MSLLTFACPMCGFEFDPAAHVACQFCPLAQDCTLVCCPACGHATVNPERSRLARWAARFFSRSRGLEDQSSERTP